MKDKGFTKQQQEKRLNKDKLRWENWKAKFCSVGISGISKTNSDLIIQYLRDMEMGMNVSSRVTRGPQFKFSGVVSFVVDCKTQKEVDYFWKKLSEGGEEGVCGWINRDKYGVT